MPVYEYKCEKCQKVFSIQLTISEYEKTKSYSCPDCKSKDVKRVFSKFTAITSKKS